MNLIEKMIRKLTDNLFTNNFLISILIIALILGLILAIPVYFLWNWLILMIFNVDLITFWQSWSVSFFFLTIIFCEGWISKH
jgi:hypothetical protein